MKFDILTEVKMLILVFRVLMPCGLVGRYQRFSKTLIFSGLKMEIVCFCKILVSTYKSTQHYNPEDQYRHEMCFYRPSMANNTRKAI
jgi:hypothetical protein